MPRRGLLRGWRFLGSSAMGNDRRLWGVSICGAGLLAGLSLAPLGLPPLLWPALALLWALAGSPPPSALQRVSNRAAIWICVGETSVANTDSCTLPLVVTTAYSTIPSRMLIFAGKEICLFA